jgi:hypothetical protein
MDVIVAHGHLLELETKGGELTRQPKNSDAPAKRASQITSPVDLCSLCIVGMEVKKIE